MNLLTLPREPPLIAFPVPSDDIHFENHPRFLHPSLPIASSATVARYIS